MASGFFKVGVMKTVETYTVVRDVILKSEYFLATLYHGEHTKNIAQAAVLEWTVTANETRN